MTFLKNIVAPFVGLGILAFVLAFPINLPVIGLLVSILGGIYFTTKAGNKFLDKEKECLNTTEFYKKKVSFIESEKTNREIEAASLRDSVTKYEAMIERLHDDKLKDQTTINNLRLKVDEYIKLNDIALSIPSVDEVLVKESKPKTTRKKAEPKVKKVTK